MVDYFKLVRDKIPEIIASEGKTPYFHIASGSELEDALWRKLDEEVAEFKVSGDQKELADILEVVYAIAGHYNVNPEDLEKLRQEKEASAGGFSKRILLEKVE